MNYQIVIAKERRTGNRVTPFTETGQLHCISQALGPEFLTDDNILMVAEWDGQAEFVTVLKGDYSTRTLHFAGWPMVTQAGYVVLEGRA